MTILTAITTQPTRSRYCMYCSLLHSDIPVTPLSFTFFKNLQWVVMVVVVMMAMIVVMVMVSIEW